MPRNKLSLQSDTLKYSSCSNQPSYCNGSLQFFTESNDDEIRGQIDDFSDDEDFVTCPPNNNNKVIVVNKANNVESAPQKSNSYSAHSSIQPQRTATASIKLAPSPKVTRKRSKSPPNSNHDNKSNVVR